MPARARSAPRATLEYCVCPRPACADPSCCVCYCLRRPHHQPCIQSCASACFHSHAAQHHNICPPPMRRLRGASRAHLFVLPPARTCNNSTRIDPPSDVHSGKSRATNKLRTLGRYPTKLGMMVMVTTSPPCQNSPNIATLRLLPAPTTTNESPLLSLLATPTLLPNTNLTNFILPSLSPIPLLLCTSHPPIYICRSHLCSHRSRFLSKRNSNT